MLKLSLAALMLASLLMTGCKDAASPSAAGGAKSASAPVSIAAIAAEATGFTAGSAVSARTVYVFFDAQCPHCSELWRNAKPLKSQAKFVWIPVGLLNAASTAQGATLLASKDAVALMDEHEASMLAKRGGISGGSDIDAQKEAVQKYPVVESLRFCVHSDHRRHACRNRGAGDQPGLTFNRCFGPADRLAATGRPISRALTWQGLRGRCATRYPHSFRLFRIS